MQLRRIETNESLRSLLAYGSSDFPFAYFDDDLMQYEGHTVAWHWHHAFECSLVTVGPVHCKIFKYHYILNKGDVLFINSGAVHSFWGSRGGNIKSVIFFPEFVAPEGGSVFREYVEPVLASPLSHMVLYRKDAVRTTVAECMRTCCRHAEADRDPMRMLKLQGDVNMLWQRLCPRILPGSFDSEAGDTGTLSKTIQNRGQFMIDFIHSHYGNRIMLDDIAQAAHVSRREALRCFSACFDTTPIAYLNDYRLQQARRLLAQTEKTVTEIALTTGFDNPGYFCKVFHKHTKMTPLQYRRQAAPRPLRIP